MKRKQVIICLLMFLMGFSNAYSQNESDRYDNGGNSGEPGYVNKFFQLYTEAKERIDMGFYEEALRPLHKLDSLYPNNANIIYNLGLCYVNIPYSKTKAIPYLERAINSVSIDYNGEYKDTTAPVFAYFYLADAYIAANRINEAIDYNRKFYFYIDKYYAPVYYSDRSKADLLVDTDKQLEICYNANKYTSDPIRISLKNLGANVNSKKDDFNVFQAPDGKTIYFTSRTAISKQSELYMKTGEDFTEDIYKSVLDTATGMWQKREKVFKHNNESEFNSIVGLSVDGAKMFIYRRDVGEGDLFSSQFQNGHWSDPVTLGPDINHPKSCELHASLSPDGKTLYFASSRKGGMGGFDIWSSSVAPNGKYSKPVLLDETINTKYDDVAPVFSSDGNTLYFSSEGHETMGGLDVFKCTKNADGTWGNSENIGYPLNTPDDNIFVSFTKDGSNAFLSTVRDSGYGELDIYHAVVLEKLKHFTIKGIVIDSVTMKPIAATVMVLKEQDTVSLTKTGEKGDYLFSLSSLNTYTLRVNAQYYKGYKKTIDLKEDVTYIMEEDKIKLQPESVAVIDSIKKAETVIRDSINGKKPAPEVIVLKNIYFNFNAATLTEESKPQLERLINFMKNNPSVKIEVSGHTDNIGPAAYNKTLSDLRAKTVADYVISKGIDKSRLTAKGYGFDKPVASNDTEEGRQANRRTEFAIIK